MSVKAFLKTKPQLYAIAFNVLKYIGYFNYQFKKSYKNLVLNDRWKSRIELVLSCPDNDKIPKVENAGKIVGDYQLMHNGLKINLGSYYNSENALLLEKNHGIHEPQEEYVFQEVLKTLQEGSTMIELGSYWSFYSMWFAQKISNYNCYMVEPDPHKMLLGVWNFKINNFKGRFKNGFISANSSEKGAIPVCSIDSLMQEFNLGFVDILHSDIQGYELEMLEGAEQSVKLDKIGYFFISTHSNELHKDSLRKLKAWGFEIICEADLDASFSWDGLIVAKSKKAGQSPSVNISKNEVH